MVRLVSKYMTEVNKFEAARLKYKPEYIKWLFIAESPPKVGSDRFFYFEGVWDGDSLFLEMMKVLYPDRYTDTKVVRATKPEFLRRFQEDGGFLIDTSLKSMEKIQPSAKRRQLRAELPGLLERVKGLCVEHSKVVLISAPVYGVCLQPLVRQGYPVINREMIDFPGSGGQVKFRHKLSQLLAEQGWSLGRRTEPAHQQ